MGAHCRARASIHSKQVRMKYGFLYAGLRTQAYWWDTVIQLRKFGILSLISYANIQVLAQHKRIACMFVYMHACMSACTCRSMHACMYARAGAYHTPRFQDNTVESMVYLAMLPSVLLVLQLICQPYTRMHHNIAEGGAHLKCCIGRSFKVVVTTTH